MNILRPLLFLFLLFPFHMSFPLVARATTPRAVRVGIYQNDPKVSRNLHGHPQGIFVDVLEAIARAENWRLDYRFGTWQENLTRLENGEIDILVDVAVSAKRLDKFLMSRGAVIESWLETFSLEEKRIQGIPDLSGKRVAVLQGSIQENYLNNDLKDSLHLDFEVVPFADYPSSVQAVVNGQTDLLVADRFFYFSPLRPSVVIPNHVILRPGGLHFAFCRQGCSELAEAVDAQLARMKNDPESEYYVFPETLAIHSHKAGIPHTPLVPVVPRDWRVAHRSGVDVCPFAADAGTPQDQRTGICQLCPSKKPPGKGPTDAGSPDGP